MKSGSGALGGSVNFETKDARDYLIEKNYYASYKRGYNTADNQNLNTLTLAGRYKWFDAIVVATSRKGNELENFGYKDFKDNIQGKERESRQNGEIPARKRSIDGLLHLSSRYWGSDSHCTGIYAKQHMAHHSFHVCRQTDTLYSSPVCTRKCLGRYSRVRILNIR